MSRADPYKDVLAFLAARVAAPRGSCVGRSSDALVTWTLAGAPSDVPRDCWPRDGGDLARCRRTIEMAPPAMAERMRPVVDEWAKSIPAHLRGDRR